MEFDKLSGVIQPLLPILSWCLTRCNAENVALASASKQSEPVTCN